MGKANHPFTGSHLTKAAIFASLDTLGPDELRERLDELNIRPFWSSKRQLPRADPVANLGLNGASFDLLVNFLCAQVGVEWWEERDVAEMSDAEVAAALRHMYAPYLKS